MAVDNEIGGALELQAAVRPEVRGIVQGLRDRGSQARRDYLRRSRGANAKACPGAWDGSLFRPGDAGDKLLCQKLRQEGRKVCFVGDGITVTIALKKANVGISLRGATMIATDTAQIVFMEQSLGKLCELLDIAQGAEA